MPGWPHDLIRDGLAVLDDILPEAAPLSRRVTSPPDYRLGPLPHGRSPTAEACAGNDRAIFSLRRVVLSRNMIPHSDPGGL